MRNSLNLDLSASTACDLDTELSWPNKSFSDVLESLPASNSKHAVNDDQYHNIQQQQSRINKLESCAVVSTCRPMPAAHLITRIPWPLTSWPPGQRMPRVTKYMSADFGVHSSSRFDFRMITDTQTKWQMQLITYPRLSRCRRG